jgi:hypothetical protein
MPAWRNVSFVPAASPLCSTGTDPSATVVTAGLNMPVPIIARIDPGSAAVQCESTSMTSAICVMPAAMSTRPAPIIARGEIFSTSWLDAPATTKFTIVPGR